MTHTNLNPNPSIRISVRMMAEFILRQGSIDSRYQSAVSPQEGTRIHQRLQRKRQKEALLLGYSYEKEVFFSHAFVLEGFDFVVEGRADGLIRRDGETIIEEIKSTLAPLELIEREESHWHWAQAKCYAYMLAMRDGLDAVSVQLTYVHAETEEEKCFLKAYSQEELGAFFHELTGRYFRWAEMDYHRKRLRTVALQGLDFPHAAYRKGQRELAAAVYRTISRGMKLFAQAPTGTGKTMSVLFPAVKAMGQGLGDRIFYLTARTITRQTAEDAVKLMNQKGGMMNQKGGSLLSITLTAKDKLCFCPEQSCNPDECAYANGHFDRINDAVWDAVTRPGANGGTLRREDIQAHARAHMVCPYEMALDIATWTDVIIGDYNYVFDPKVQLKRFFADTPREKYILLVDEAHNLVDRSREMYSAVLYKQDFHMVARLVKPGNAALARLCNQISRFFLDYKRQHMDESAMSAVTRDEPLDLYHMLRDFAVKVDEMLSGHGELPDELLECYFGVLDFIRVSEAFGPAYTILIEDPGKRHISIKLLCMDASAQLRDIQAKAASTILFSATLTPLSYFRQVLGGSDEDYVLRKPSPFDRDKLCLVVEDRISTRYKDREGSYNAIAQRLYAMVSARTGNYIAFFPSYAYLLRVYECFINAYPELETAVQDKDMTEEEREAFLLLFQDKPSSSLLAFAVMGGLFSEGVDLVGDRLIGVAIIGVGLPLITPERDAIADYYGETLGHAEQGYAYAYVYPGMNKVMQSAGRVIRTENDRGIVLLIDDRFVSMRYLALFPPEWASYERASRLMPLEAHLRCFWHGDNKEEESHERENEP